MMGMMYYVEGCIWLMQGCMPGNGYVLMYTLLKLKLKLFTTCAVCAGLQLVPHAPVAVSEPSQQCHSC
jgi:hypothetical protein